jgi:hypothetical protein
MLLNPGLTQDGLHRWVASLQPVRLQAPQGARQVCHLGQVVQQLWLGLLGGRGVWA